MDKVRPSLRVVASALQPQTICKYLKLHHPITLGTVISVFLETPLELHFRSYRISSII